MTVEEIAKAEKSIREHIRDEKYEDAILTIIYTLAQANPHVLIAEEMIEEFFNRFMGEEGKKPFTEEDFFISFSALKQKGFIDKT